MGLHSSLTDLSGDSIPLLILAMVASAIGNLHYMFFSVLNSLGLSRHPDEVDLDESFFGVGTGMSGLVVLNEQHDLNRAASHRYRRGEDGAAGAECVVCLSAIREGEHVRRLACRHVFHRDCFGGWLDHLNFSCPLCRAPVQADQHVNQDAQHVGGIAGFFHLFSLH